MGRISCGFGWETSVGMGMRNLCPRAALHTVLCLQPRQLTTITETVDHSLLKEIFTHTNHKLALYFLKKIKVRYQQRTRRRDRQLIANINKMHSCNFITRIPYWLLSIGWPLSRNVKFPDISLKVRGTAAHVNCYSYHVCYLLSVVG